MVINDGSPPWSSKIGGSEKSLCMSVAFSKNEAEFIRNERQEPSGFDLFRGKHSKKGLEIMNSPAG